MNEETKPDMVNHPRHYTIGYQGVECIEIMRELPASAGAAFKYVWRAGAKGSKGKFREDIEKAIWSLNDAIKHRRSTFTEYSEVKRIGALLATATQTQPAWRIHVLYLIWRRNYKVAMSTLQACLKDKKWEGDL